MSTRAKIALALGGGGARGLAHIGILKVLEKARIPIDLITGTSIGAVVGAMYAQNPDASVLEKKFLDFLKSPIYKHSGLELFIKKKEGENFFAQVATAIKERLVINIAQSRCSLTSNRKLVRALQFLLDDVDISETRIKFAATAVDLLSGQGVVLKEGSLIKAVVASSSIPGFLPPFSYDGRLLVDGAVTFPVPVQPALELGADLVIAVDVGQDLECDPELDNVIDVIFRTNLITARNYNALLLEKADIVLRPRVGQIHWAEFKHIEQLILEGEQTALKALSQIERLIKSKRSFWEKLFAK
ncbi:MAG: patatin-like phospholipase family protein [candidate division KSB1 bacterium]|nr:patatin-like phospholipase family protein [candidate division KSB1 bacterium]